MSGIYSSVLNPGAWPYKVERKGKNRPLSLDFLFIISYCNFLLYLHIISTVSRDYLNLDFNQLIYFASVSVTHMLNRLTM